MNEQEKINSLFEEVGFYSGNRDSEFYLPISKALQYLEKCAENKLLILGLDCLRKLPNGIRPEADYDCSREYSHLSEWNNKLDFCYQNVRKAIESWPMENDYYVTFIVVSEKEYNEMGK